MGIYSTKVIQDDFVIPLHPTLIERMGLIYKESYTVPSLPNVKVSFTDTVYVTVTFQRVSHVLVMQKLQEGAETDLFTSKVDEYGQIQLPEPLMDEMKWEVRDHVRIYRIDNNMAIIRLEE